MDWLDERLDKLRKRIHNLSLRKALFAYIVICIISVAILSAITLSFCDRWDNFIWSGYSDIDLQGAESLIVYSEDYPNITRIDRVLVEVIDFLQTWSAFLYSIVGIIGVSYLFYNIKLKEPLRILKEATDKVGNNDLNIEIYYDSKDEMGNLCNSFDTMRKQLIANNQKMWDVMEEQKRLNAAFAHDLRTPLTVLRGYIDFLNQYIPEGKVDEEKLLSTLTIMSNHIKRLERYSNTMKEINSLEEIPIHRIPSDHKTIQRKLEEVIAVLDGKNGITVKLTNSISEDIMTYYLDETILMEVFENLMSNALRYAKSEVEVMLTLSENENQFIVSVGDDGKGFSVKDLSMATKPYYTNNIDNKSEHFGIGLYICKLLCEKHNGSITIANRIKQGAIITSVFYIGK